MVRPSFKFVFGTLVLHFVSSAIIHLIHFVYVFFFQFCHFFRSVFVQVLFDFVFLFLSWFSFNYWMQVELDKSMDDMFQVNFFFVRKEQKTRENRRKELTQWNWKKAAIRQRISVVFFLSLVCLLLDICVCVW